ncbi:hypothetical protein JL722_15057 [Aureococcus anophagefferens]|nr:hypothetical protein JL722_15057 [Aureococcus anophagefferens]
MLSRLARNLGATQSARPETSSAPRVEDPATTPRAPSRGYFGRRRSANADAKARRDPCPRARPSGPGEEAPPGVAEAKLDRGATERIAAPAEPAAKGGEDDDKPSPLAAGRPGAKLADLCGELGFDAGVETYAASSATTLDGWVFAEIDEWEDYCEIGMKRDHAVVLCCVAKAVKGAFGAPLWVAGPRLTDEEIASLRQADDVAAETGEAPSTGSSSCSATKYRPFNRILFQSDGGGGGDDETASNEGDGSFSTNTPRDRTPSSSDRKRQTDDLSNAS